MATATQAQILSRIRRKLFEGTAARFTDETLREWINEGVGEIVRRTECQRTYATIPAVAGTQEYPGFNNTVRIHAVNYTSTSSGRSYDLEYNDYKSVASVAWTTLATAEGTPSIYWTWGSPPGLTIGLYPTPSQAGTIGVHYYRFATPLAINGSAAATSVDVPQGWEDLIIEYAVIEAMISDRDERYAIYQEKFEKKLSALQDASVRFNDQAGVINVGRSAIPQWLYDSSWD